ncbi:unnamed protein product [Phyllotreta striolata]|uniref:Peroxidase n=1 Tax=Phyllotreta striolata TaxID=444603 RepID=A0A9N9XMM1_PHYSR|nr:unnamed protein product [Phyllotreta striolata]
MMFHLTFACVLLLPHHDVIASTAPPPGRNYDLSIESSVIEDAIDFAMTNTGYEKRFEETIKQVSRLVPGTPAEGAYAQLVPDDIAIERSRQARLAVKVTAQVAYSVCLVKPLSFEECDTRLRKVNFARTSLSAICDHLNKNCTVEQALDPYRSSDGSCNHVEAAARGESHTAFSRLTRPNYKDSIETPKRSVTKASMPSARKISNALVNYESSPHDYLTAMFPAWGMFVEHDLARFASSVMVHFNDSFRCCDELGFNLAPRYTHAQCMPVQVPQDDRYYSNIRLECMSYVRSMAAIRGDCSLGHLEQQNLATHYLDGSQLYGTHASKSTDLRRRRDGRLESESIEGVGEFPGAMERCPIEDGVCFESGDPRVNFLPQSAVLYAIWLREHNRLAAELAELNRHWDDERLYQEARRIVVAEMQRITYEEWLPHLLDAEKMKEIDSIDTYDESIDPSVSNEFAAAAVRALYSMIGSQEALRDDYNNPKMAVERFDGVVEEMARRSADNIDLNYSEDLIDQLFSNGDFGYDLVSLDVQRGRDNGLPGYNAYRELCGLKKAQNFDDLTDVIPESEALILSRVYQHVDDIDLLIGGLCERPAGDSLAGPTLSCILGDQFGRTKRGDRYFYANRDQPKPFGELQLAEIRKATLAGVICGNADLAVIQPSVFRRIDDNNMPVSCDGIEKVDLAAWREDREKYELV